jgi:hypothetical protein
MTLPEWCQNDWRSFNVMAGLDPAIHALLPFREEYP